MLTDAWEPMFPHKQQSAAWRCKKRFVALFCGRGSGKTDLARRRCVRFLNIKKPWPDPKYFYALPTVAQAHRVAWEQLLALIPTDWLSDVNQGKMTIKTVFGSTLFVFGMDKPMRAEGVQYDGGVIDESSDQKPGMYRRTFKPAFIHRNAWCWRIGVPKRFGVGGREFKEFCDLGISGKDPDVAAFTWDSESVLRLLGKEDTLREDAENMDPRDYREQYGASWESSGGTCFWSFDPVLNVSEAATYRRDLPLVVGSDFNVSPMSWVLGHLLQNAQGVTELHIFDEIFKRDTNTPTTLTYLYDRYGKEHDKGFEFYGDASGKARKTSASQSDYAHIRNDKRFVGARVFYPDSNPRIVDRFAACNAMFLNAAGRRRCFIHPRCKNLIKDLQDRVWKEGSMEPDDYGDVGHITDALGYVIHRRFPVVVSVDSGAPNVGMQAT